MKGLTDLEICKRLAEIEGLEFIVKMDVFGFSECVFADSENHAGLIRYNPLTDDALCFRLMIKYNVSFWQNEDKGMFCAKVRDPEFGVVRVKKPNIAICLAIIASKV
jgi:hypothetical protein